MWEPIWEGTCIEYADKRGTFYKERPRLHGDIDLEREEYQRIVSPLYMMTMLPFMATARIVNLLQTKMMFQVIATAKKKTHTPQEAKKY
jgi:hypothetical protein